MNSQTEGMDQSLLEIRIRPHMDTHMPSSSTDYPAAYPKPDPLDRQIEWSFPNSERWIPGPTLREVYMMRNPVFVLVSMTVGMYRHAMRAKKFVKEVECYIKSHKELYDERFRKVSEQTAE